MAKKIVARKRASAPPTETALRAAWARKVALVAQEAPNPPCTGVHKGQADEYPYTRAQEVYQYYHPVLLRHHLAIVPGQIKTCIDVRAYRVECEWLIIDTQTGYQVSMWSAGLGTNGIWSLQSAVTVAKKQLLLTLFMGSWPCEFDVSLDASQALGEASMWDMMGPREVARVLDGFKANITNQLNQFFEAVHREMHPKKG